MKHVSNLTPLQCSLSKASLDKRAQVLEEKEQRRNDPTGAGPTNLARWCLVCGGMGHGPGTCPDNPDKDEWCDRCKSKGHRSQKCRTPQSSLARCIKAGEKRREQEQQKAVGAWFGNTQKGGRPNAMPQGKVSNGEFGTLPPHALPDVQPGVNAFNNFAKAPDTSSSIAALAAGMTGQYPHPNMTQTDPFLSPPTTQNVVAAPTDMLGLTANVSSMDSMLGAAQPYLQFGPKSSQ